MPNSDVRVGFTVILRAVDEMSTKEKVLFDVYVIVPQSTVVLSLNSGNICGAKTGEARTVVVMF
jgi:hypothetical protein